MFGVNWGLRIGSSRICATRSLHWGVGTNREVGGCVGNWDEGIRSNDKHPLCLTYIRDNLNTLPSLAM